jgi:peptide/nickel transport system substrate-binding protein
MFARWLTLIVGVLVIISQASKSDAKTFYYANQGDLKSLDPHTLDETTANAHLSHVYEGLVRRNKQLQIEPCLAERWEVSDDGLRWRFHLRKFVTFHDGTPFTADDVILSATRVRSPESNHRTRIPLDARFEKIDDHTVDMLLASPNPTLVSRWDTWFIMSRRWIEGNNAQEVTSVSATASNFASLHANGTGPFRVESHQPGVRTVFKANMNWWDKPEHNLTEIIFTPIVSGATRVAALLAGDLDLIEPVPLQDIERVSQDPRATALTGSEIRTIFLGFDQMRDELPDSNVKGRNPFKDRRVREAFFIAIDADAIVARVMRGLATPTALMIAPQLFPSAREFRRPKHDPERARGLLAEAGYPNGFEVGMDCPNDRYVNDGDICQAVAAMLARIGVKVNLNAQPKARFFAKVLRSNGYQTSFYLLGWTPSTTDAHDVLFDVHGCRTDPNSARGHVNLGNYCNPEVESLLDKLLTERDAEKREALIKQAFQITTGDFAYIPLHQQALAWGVSRKAKVTQRADNSVLLYWATKE